MKKVIPQAKELKKILKLKRRARRHAAGAGHRYNDTEFPYDDENIIYIVAIKILESYHSQFS